MNKSLYKIFTVVVFISVLLISCGSGKKFEKLSTEVQTVAKTINDRISVVYESAKKLDTEIESYFKSTDLTSVDISKMDVANGGNFETFQEKMYVEKFDQKEGDAIAVFFGAEPITDKIKKQMFLLDSKFGPEIEKLVNDDPTISRITIQAPVNSMLTYPPLDVASIFPAGFDYSVAPWYTLYKKSKKNPSWIDPTISLGPEGWVQGVGFSIDPDGVFLGTCAFDMAPLEFVTELVKDSESMLIVLFNDLTVVATTESAKGLLKGIEVIQEYDYVKQLQENPEAPKELRLNYEKYGSDIQSLARLVTKENAGKEDLTVSINGESYNAAIALVELTNYYVVGLVK